MYSKQQKQAALDLYKQTESVSETVRIPGYPTRENLYNWIYEKKKNGQREKKKERYGNPPNHPGNPSFELKLEAIKRCFENGENIMYVSEEIGYSRASIYQWRKRYLKDGALGIMNNRSIHSSDLDIQISKSSNTVSNNEEIQSLKQQISSMQLEIDILKETINVLKKDPGINLAELTNHEKTVIIDGLGLVLSSQRPSELSPTVISQCNSFLLHRLSNDRDQELVSKLVPDNLRGMLRELPSLPARNAILLGWASELPVMVRMNYLNDLFRPKSDDPEYWSTWTESNKRVKWDEISKDWQDYSNTERTESIGIAEGIQ